MSAAAAAGVAPLGADVSVGVGQFRFGICSPERGNDITPELVAVNGVSPGYFNAMEVPIVEGRDFTLSDRGAASPTNVPPVVVNQALARKLFPKASAVGQANKDGKRLHEAVRRPDDCGCRQRQSRRSAQRGAAELFLPLGAFQGPVTLIVRTPGDPGSMIPTVRRAMTELNANTPTFSEAPVTDLVERRLRRERLLSSLLTAFAVVTVFICCLGIYGMLSHAVERRRQEISVRMAIGAQTADVVRLMVRSPWFRCRPGSSLAVLSVLANRWLAQLLYGVSSYDPLTLASASVIFLLVAVAAGALPSRAAARVNPVLALRQ